jgi:hypothetical protein
MFNIEFSKTNKAFRAACERVGTEPTSRQASKYRSGMGIAYSLGRPAAQPKEDLSSLTCKALRQRCADRGIKVASKARKADLIAALEG